MNELELSFFNEKAIDLYKCFNADGRKVDAKLRLIMKINDCTFAYNTSSCKNNPKHTIQNTSGRCVICRSDYIAYSERENKIGYVYIAGSKWGQRIKIGASEKYEERQKSLNENKGYASLADWKILAAIKVNRMGFCERNIQNTFNRYRDTKIQYYKGKDLKRSNETFRCNYEKVLEYLRLYSKENRFILKVFERDVTKYNFRNLIKPQEYVNQTICKILEKLKK